MAERIFKGRILLTGDIQRENMSFPEAAPNFNEESLGGLRPFEILREVLQGIDSAVSDMEKCNYYVATAEDGSLFLRGGDTWVKIDPNGDIEIGSSG